MRCDTKCVLVVDDVIPNLKLLSAILATKGYTVYEASTGADAIEIAKEKHPGIMLLDVMMPGMDGFELCKRLKADPETAESAIIYISAKNSAEDKIKGLELGAVDYITKPFQKAEVIARVETHVALQNAKIRLEESERLYSTLVESSSNGIFLWSSAKGIFFLNQTIKRLLATPKDNGVVSIADILAQKQRKDFLASLTEVERSPAKAKEGEFVMTPMSPKDAPQLHVNCSMVGVTIHDEPAVFVSVKDMTERLLFEQHIQHSQKMEALGLLCSGIANDFNNLLSLICGYSELAILEAGSDSPLSERLKDILSASKNAVSLTKGLFAFTRNKGMEQESLDLSVEVRNICAVLARSMPAAIEFNCKVPEGKTPVLADAAMLQQLVVSLCLNGRDSMPSGGRLSVSLSIEKLKRKAAENGEPRESDYAVISVSDTGSGIPDSLKSKIFDPFFTTKSKGHLSSGLGLSISDQIAHAHNGWMDFESEVGKGSTFKAAIPLSKVCEINERRAKVGNYKHLFRVELNPILLANADESELEMNKYFLEKEGYKVSTVRSSDEARLSVLKAMKVKRKFGLLIIARSALAKSPDISLDSLKEISNDSKILAISDSGSIPVADVPLLKKPFSVKDFLQTLDRL